jgi:enterochelin esterase-like enzyme
MPALSPRIARLLDDLPARGPAAVDELWREVEASGTPLIEAPDGDSALVTFVWRGEASETATAWGLNISLERIPGTDLWHGSRRLPADLRTIYYLTHASDGVPTTLDGTGPAHVDLANPRRFHFPADRSDPTDYHTWTSILELPSAPAEPWSTPTPGVARGAMLQTSIQTSILGGRRRIGVYRPAARHRTPYALLVVFDGFLSRTVLRIPTTLDNLIAAGRIPPTMALFVNSPSGKRRFRELRPKPAIRDFVVRELMPWAQRRWPIADDPHARVISGSSLGGLAAAYVGLEAPHVFGGVVAQSGSFWWPGPPATEPEWLTRSVAARPRSSLRFALDVGDHEIDSPRGDGLDQLTVNRRFRDALLDRGYPVTYTEYAGAHDYINWRRTFADGLQALLGT